MATDGGRRVEIEPGAGGMEGSHAAESRGSRLLKTVSSVGSEPVGEVFAIQ
jgi:hypothetical protein